MHIVFLVDSSPSDTSAACGIGDYTVRLADELRHLSTDVLVLDQDQWDRIGTSGIIRRIKSYEPDVLHIQYPTIGYFRGFVAPILAMTSPAQRIVLTAHEFSQSHPLRRACVSILARNSTATIFPSDFERRFFLNHHSQLKNRTCVIPIGSNITPIESTSNKERRSSSVLYFGQIRPQKGIEEFIKLAEVALGQRCPYDFSIVGTPHPRHRGYYQTLRDETSRLPIQWVVGLAEEGVRGVLSSTTYAYLPFPDGASERRGSLLAALGNGLVIFTTRGEQTPIDLQDAVTFVGDATETLKMLNLFEKDAFARQKKSSAAVEYSKSFSWEQIAASHLSLYEQIATTPHSRHRTAI